MDDEATVVLLAGVAVLALPWSSPGRHVNRLLVASVLFILQTRYLCWRLTKTIPDLTWDFATMFAYGFLTFELWAESLTIREWLAYCKARNRGPDVDKNLDWYKHRPPPRVDILIPTYNELPKIVELAAVTSSNQDYPNVRVWVLDDGKRREIQELAAERGVHYLTRPDNRHYKAGNLNHALAHIRALPDAPEFVAIVDCDFALKPNFVKRSLALMHDPKIAMVQTKQVYFNADPFQRALGLTNVMPDWQRFLFDVALPARDANDNASCCGTAFLGRMSALEEIGDFKTDCVAEDSLTTMALHEKGYVVAYLDEGLSFGIVAEGAREFWTQCSRWCLGGVQILYTRWGAFTRERMSWFKRLMSLEESLGWGVFSAAQVYFVCLPGILWFVDFTLFGNRVVPAEEFYAMVTPLLVYRLAAMIWLSRGATLPVISDGRSFLASFATVRATIKGLSGAKNVKFEVTDKGNLRTGTIVHWNVLRWILLIAGTIVVGMLLGTFDGGGSVARQQFGGTLYFWSFYSLLVLFVAGSVCVEPPARREDERFATNEKVRISAAGVTEDATLTDISLGGVFVRSKLDVCAADDLRVELDGVGWVRATLARHDATGFGARLELASEQRVRLINKIFQDRYVRPVMRADIPRVYARLLQRFFL